MLVLQATPLLSHGRLINARTAVVIQDPTFSR
jgi:hypothetical protein